MTELQLACDGGKDSLSMAAAAGGETVMAPGNLVVSAYVGCPDVTKVGIGQPLTRAAARAPALAACCVCTWLLPGTGLPSHPPDPNNNLLLSPPQPDSSWPPGPHPPPQQLSLSPSLPLLLPPHPPQVATPDLKLSREGGALLHVDLANGWRRLGGSALAQAYAQVRLYPRGTP